MSEKDFRGRYLFFCLEPHISIDLTDINLETVQRRPA